MPIKVTDKDFDEKVLKSKQPVLVDFWASWCGPCLMQNPILEQVAKDLSGQATVAKLNVDENQATAQKYGVMSIPTLIIFKDGKSVKQYIGVQSQQMLVEELKKLL